MAEFKHTYWGRQIDNIARELSKLAIICDIELGRPGLAERILKNDDSVCGRKNPKAFRQIRQHLMALFTLEGRAIERLGPEDTREILGAAFDRGARECGPAAGAGDGRSAATATRGYRRR